MKTKVHEVAVSFSSGGATTHTDPSSPLNCPVCGNSNLHQKRITSEEDKISIDFWCEHCNTDMSPFPKDIPYRLDIIQHKGSTYLKWVCTAPDIEATFV